MKKSKLCLGVTLVLSAAITMTGCGLGANSLSHGEEKAIASMQEERRERRPASELDKPYDGPNASTYYLHKVSPRKENVEEEKDVADESQSILGPNATIGDAIPGNNVKGKKQNKQ